MVFNLDNPYEADKFRKRVAELLHRGGGVELKRIHQQRTMAQNRYLHLLLGYFGSEFGLSLDEVKVDYFKRTVNADIFKAKRLNRKGKEVNCLRSTAELDRGEMTTAIERFRNWSAAVAGLYLPSANEQEALLWMQRQVENDKEYIYEGEDKET